MSWSEIRKATKRMPELSATHSGACGMWVGLYTCVYTFFQML